MYQNVQLSQKKVDPLHYPVLLIFKLENVISHTQPHYTYLGQKIEKVIALSYKRRNKCTVTSRETLLFVAIYASI